MKWLKQLQQSIAQTPACKSCFESINYTSFHKIFSFDEKVICDNCIFESKPVFKSFKINGIKGLAIYDYSPFIRTKFFLYKICEDYELKDYFLKPYSLELKLLFNGYKIVPIPSYIENDKARGYNHAKISIV